MALVRHKQRAITAVSPHQGNRRIIVPKRSLATPPSQATDLADSDGWFILTPEFVGGINYGFNGSTPAGTVQPELWNEDKDPSAALAYFGSFGENYFNVRFSATVGGAQTHRPVGSPDIMVVSINGIGGASFPWDITNARYQGNWTGLAAKLQALQGTEVLCRLGSVK